MISMKRSVLVLLILALLVSIFPVVTAASAAVTYGDLDGDKKVTSSDALTVLKSVVGKVSLNDEQIAAGDVDVSTKVDAADADITILNEGHDVAIVPAGLKKGIGTQSKAQIYLRDPGSTFASIDKSLYEANYKEVAQVDVDALVDYIEQEIGVQASEGGLSSYTEYIISTDTMEITILHYPSKNEVKVSAYLN